MERAPLAQKDPNEASAFRWKWWCSINKTSVESTKRATPGFWNTDAAKISQNTSWTLLQLCRLTHLSKLL